MRMMRLLSFVAAIIVSVSLDAAQPPSPSSTSPQLDQYKRNVGLEVDALQENIQKWNDSVFSFGELGFQEFETTKYLTAILKQNGFTVQEGVAGIPTAWTARWGSGKPVIALGSDVDCIPQASQKPGVAYHDPIIEGAPGHGEGHNSGMPLQIAAALAVKKVMEQQHLQGTLMLWPGIAEELVGTKAYYVRAGLFKDVDISIFAHVGENLDQPNVVPPNAAVWYYFRETDYPHIKEMWEIGDRMAKAASMMTDTEVSMKVLGSAWPGHFNKTIAETMYANIEKVGLPQWTEADQTLAKALQHELKVPEVGMATKLQPLRGRELIPDEEKRGGGSDDIGDISWNLPTVTLRYPSNMAAGPGHNWANAISMATPIAHKGIHAGAKVVALTVLDFLMKPELVTQAWDYFRNVQTKNVKYTPLMRPEDKPAIWLNEQIMAKYRAEMKKYYYDPTKYKTYLEQLGIKYPTVRQAR